MSGEDRRSKMLVQVSIIILATFAITTTQHNNVVIKLQLVDSCITAAKFDWLIFGLEDSSLGINCSVHYGHASDFNTSHTKVRPYPSMVNEGSFTLQGLDSLAGRQFSVQLRCGDAFSDVITFVVNDKKVCNDTGDQSKSDEPVMFQDNSSILGTRDSLLGILFGSIGLLIIAISTFYVMKKIRRRNRLERIRRYLGPSLIDPFENLQNRIDSDRDTGSERLMGESTDRLFLNLNRNSEEQNMSENTE